MMKRIYFLMLAFGVFTATGFAQITGPDSEHSPNDPVPPPGIPNEERLYTTVEEMPAFPGGDVALAKFLANNIRYPESAKKQRIEGKVYVEFVVEADGSITNIKIRRGITHDLDIETIRAIKLMPKWIPGKQGGKNVRVSYTLPVEYKLR